MPTVALDALGITGGYRTRNPEVVTDTAGEPVAELSAVPRLFVTRTLAAQRRSAPLRPGLRAGALARAAELFTTAVVADCDFDTYVELTARITGLPTAVARAGGHAVAAGLAGALTDVHAARPAGAADDWRSVTAGAVWARRGEVLAVHAPGNGPGVHGLWPQALALGYRVAVRPSRREPLTAHRLISVLRAAGFADSDATFLPTAHPVAADVVALADLALVYGGADIAERYRTHPQVLVNGPGRTKMLVTAEWDWARDLDVIADSVAALGGMACVNATAVLVEGDPAPLARALAERLSALPYPLPEVPLDQAHRIAAAVAHRGAAAVALLGAGQVVEKVGAGRARLRPAVHLLDRADPAVLATELPFPCVWVAPWDRAEGCAPLRDSLVVGALTSDDALIDALLAEPTIAGVHRGAVPTHLNPAGVPHDGFLADFLMVNKGFVDAGHLRG